MLIENFFFPSKNDNSYGAAVEAERANSYVINLFVRI